MDARSPDLPPDSPANVAPAAVLTGWRGERGDPSLAGMFATVRASSIRALAAGNDGGGTSDGTKAGAATL